MIEFNQPMQCLFCPQRRKIALMLKVLLAVSAAVITGLLLFPLRSDSIEKDETGTKVTRPALNRGLAMVPVKPPGSGQNPSEVQILSEEDKEFLVQAQKRHQEVQAELKSILSSHPIRLLEARNLLQSRQREILLAKVLVLGEKRAADDARSEEQKDLMVETLDKELRLVSEQLDLLTRADLKK